MEITKYTPSAAEEWNTFVEQSVNGTFMFNRSYMDYHSDQTDIFDNRFTDHSLMIYDRSNLIALLPANEKGDGIISHEGLTFGGLLVSGNLKTPKILSIFDEVQEYLNNRGFSYINYKCIPHIYHEVPASADRYALFRKDADLYRRDISSTIVVSKKHNFPRRRRRELNKANDVGLTVEQTTDLETFWKILEENLQREHGVNPTHTVDEMKHLMSEFPKNIKLFCAYDHGTMVSGALVYHSMETARIQYLSTSVDGKGIGGNEKIIDYLLNHYNSECEIQYLDFGISTEGEGRVLNEGLITYKESYDAHPFTYDFYQLKT